MLAIGLALWVYDPRFFSLAMGAIAGGIYLILHGLVQYFLLTPRMAGQAIKRALQLGTTNVSWELNDEGVRISNAESSTFYKWNAFDQLVETAHLVMLRLSHDRKCFFFLSKKALIDEQHKQEFFAVVAKHLGGDALQLT